PILDFVGAISAGIVNGEILLDLCYEEDSNAEVDMNLVMTGREKIIEFGATAEKIPMTKQELDKLLEIAKAGIKQIIEMEKKVISG
ncbi:MAG: ribonuclease PH, partial [candidate division WOR-3 bacterium]